MNDNASNTSLAISGTTGVATATGLIGTVNEYAIIIGLGISLLSLMVGFYFHVQTVNWRKEQSAKDTEKLRANIIEELNRDSLV